MNIKQMLQAKGWRTDGKLLAHWMNWFGDSHYHPMNRYKSTSPATILKQLDVMQAAGVDGIIVTWQGTSNPYGHLATLEMCMATAARGMLFCLLADPWLMNNQPAGEAQVIAQLTSTDGQAMLTAPNYIPEKYLLDFTNNLFNEDKVTAALQSTCPGFNVLKRHVGYSWPEIVNTLPTLKTDNLNPAMAIPGLFYKFFDGGSLATNGDTDYNHQTWDITQPARSIEDQGGNTFFDCLSVTPMTSKYLALVTWNDYNERTAWEPFLSIQSGIQIS